MAREGRAWLCATAIIVALSGALAAQESPPAAMADVLAAPTSPLLRVQAPPAPTSVDPWGLLAPASTAGPPADAPFEDRNGTILDDDPFLDPARFPATGIFATLETGILSPFYKNDLYGPVTIPGIGTTTVRVPTATLPWTVSPELRVGYTFSQGGGSIAVTYRALVDQGSGATPLSNGPAALQSRLNVNVVDVDYLSRECGVSPVWDLRWTVGVRIVSNYFDTEAQNATLQERISNFAFGAGPHVGMELWRWLQVPGHGLAIYGKTDAGFEFGRMEQNFEEAVLASGVPAAGGASRITATPVSAPGNGASQWLPIMRVEAGVSWVPDWAQGRLSFSGGYDFEGWWNVGRVSGPLGGASTATLTTNGVFLRAQWKF